MVTHLGAPYACHKVVDLNVWTALDLAVIESPQNVAYTGGAVSESRVCAAVDGALDERLSETTVGSLELREPL